uniref:Uncharacterized protein n=1 Tax=Anguilla anguilla TaxID=7936 RepID=A0A0E9R1W1_ANGAN
MHILQYNSIDICWHYISDLINFKTEPII